MTIYSAANPHPRHAELVEMLRDYLAETGKTARWLGIHTCGNPRMMHGLLRGRHFPATVKLSLCTRLRDYYTAQIAALESAGVEALPLAA